jgi:hypothetical protein
MQHPQFVLAQPAYLREEARLAAAMHDTAGAIHAYEQFLALRDRPDAGVMSQQVREARSHLERLRGIAGGPAVH